MTVFSTALTMLCFALLLAGGAAALAIAIPLLCAVLLGDVVVLAFQSWFSLGMLLLTFWLAVALLHRELGPDTAADAVATLTALLCFFAHRHYWRESPASLGQKIVRSLVAVAAGPPLLLAPAHWLGAQLGIKMHT